MIKVHNVFPIALLFFCSALSAQVVINEASNRNYSQISDEDEETKDWIELFNTSDDAVKLSGWSLSDNFALPDKWVFPTITIEPHSHLLIFASGKDRRDVVEEARKWETAVFPSDIFHYLVPGENTSQNWNELAYNAQTWPTGKAGFGYGDNDDLTQVPNGTMAIYIRKIFSISDTNAISQAVCHIDYDDGFVAYLNGIEIARSSIDGTPEWNSTSSTQHEAVMYNGGLPEAFILDMNIIRSAWKEGENVFAIEVHNVNTTSSDLSLVPYLSFATKGDEAYFSPAPAWLSVSLERNLHTNFKISSEGETIYLYNPGNTLIDSLTVSRNTIDYSVGRSTDGADELAVFTVATPGESNNSSTPYTNGYEQTPVFSIDAGFYDSAIDVEISDSSMNCEVRYTNDGSIPTSTSTKYNGSPIALNSTTTLRARCFSITDKLPGDTRTATYFINEDFTVPVLSVTTNNENLYGETGIFTNWGESWNKPCYVEYFDTEKRLAFRQAAGMQIDGGAGGSRSQPQHSFRIEPDHGTLGDGMLDYKLQPDRPNRDKYASFYVRNGSNQYLILPYKDAAEVKGMGKGTFNYYSAYRPIVAFINGEYFGVYELREKINADYLENNYLMDTDSLDLIGVSYFKGQTLQAIEGSIDQFLTDWNYFRELSPSGGDYLTEVDKFLDIANYTDYIIGQSWIANNDWPYNNIKAWRCESTNWRWQFALIDLEWSLKPHEWTTSTFNHIHYMEGFGTNSPYTGFWYNLMRNNEYKYYFINRYADLMNTNYSYKELNAIENEMYEEILPEMRGEYERWGSSNIDGQLTDFTSNHTIFNSELEVRSDYVRNHILNQYDLDRVIDIELDVVPKGSGKIKISTITPAYYPWKGVYFSDIPIRFEAIPNPGYSFSGWNTNEYISDSGIESFTSVISDQENVFTANFVLAGSQFEGITISEINYKDGSNFNTTDWFEIYNATDTLIKLDGWYFSDNDAYHRFEFPSSLVIPSGERLVVTKNLNNFKGNYPGISNVTGEFTFGLGSPADEINIYNQHNELVVSASYSDIFPWPLSDDLSGRTLELLDPERALDIAANWFAGCIGGSPGKAYEYCPDEYIPESVIDIPLTAQKDILNVKAYPMPVKGEHINISFYSSDEINEVTLEVYDVLGNKLSSYSAPIIYEGQQVIALDVSNLRGNQLYFVTVSTEKAKEVVKILKQ